MRNLHKPGEYELGDGGADYAHTFGDKAILAGGASDTVQVAIRVIIGLVKTDRGLRDGV